MASSRRKAGTKAPRVEHENRNVESVLEDALRYARTRDYTGWDYADGMSSKLLRSVPFENKWVNIAVQETIKRAPVNLRPYFLVEQRRNYKGTALFALANFNTAQLARHESGPSPSESSVDYRGEGEELTEWLVENRIRGYAGFCGAHRHQIQWLDRKGYEDDPDVVSTAYAVRALLRADDSGGKFADVARTAEDFIDEDLAYTEKEPGARIKYVPAHTTEHYTLNAVALGARILVDLYSRFERERFLDRARKLFDYVVSRQTDVGGWMYRDPPTSSHLSMDNHHNGFIVECLLHYEAVTGSERYADAIESGLAFYKDVLFEENGAPNWDNEQSYPRDIHGAAQGIILFSKVDDLQFAHRILGWTLNNLYAGDGRFYYQKRKHYTKRFTLMRWCQAWMTYAISTYLLRRRGLSVGPTPQTVKP